MTFKEMALAPALQQALEGMGFEKPTEIQARTIPMLLEAKKTDFHGQAQTGTGKTLAFGLPLLQKINFDRKVVQALIVAPTRELVVQICQNLRDAGKFTGISIQPIYGGVAMGGQVRALKMGAHVVVGTPGRLNDHLRRGTLNLRDLEVLVLDEADIMLDMGFKDEVDEILQNSAKDRQIWLFSATVKPGIEQIKHAHMKNVASVSASKQQIGSSATKQYFCMVPPKLRISALARFIDSVEDFYGFIFCQTKMNAIEVAEQLNALGYKAGSLHGDMSQDQRNRTIKQFKNREFGVLVATDVAARGIDVADITHVVNYSLPNDQESYVHRIGRTGRAGKQGIAITFVNKSEHFRVNALKKRFKVNIDPINVPDDRDLVEIQLKRIAALVDAEQTAATPAVASSDDMLHKVNQLLETYQAPVIKQLLAKMLREKYLKSFENRQFVPATVTTFEDDLSGSGMQEICLNVGADDGVNKFKVFEYLKKHAPASENDVVRVRVIKRRTFLVVNNDKAGELMRDLDGHSLGRRMVRAQLA